MENEVKLDLQIVLQITQQELAQVRQENILLKSMIEQNRREQETEVNGDSSDTVQANELDK